MSLFLDPGKVGFRRLFFRYLRCTVRHVLSAFRSLLSVFGDRGRFPGFLFRLRFLFEGDLEIAS